MAQKKGNIRRLMRNFILLILMVLTVNVSYAALDAADKGTFNEFRYNINQKALQFKQNFEVDRYMHKEDLDSLINMIEASFQYLPDDNLMNQRLKSDAITELKKGLKYTNDVTTYNSVLDKISTYLDDVRIEAVSGQIIATPNSGNAPLIVTLRGDVIDPFGAVLPNNNYVWYINQGTGVKVLGRKRALNYTFDDEGRFDVYLAVKSDHVNKYGNTDVLPFSSRYTITVNERFIDFNIKINGRQLRSDNYIKFTPEEARKGLSIDATGSSPTKGSEFSKTEWDFGNGIERENQGDPRIEKAVYNKEGTFDVELKLRTNDNHIATKKFTIEVRETLAEVSASKETGFIGDKITFSARLASKEDEENFAYSWEIIDVDKDKTVYTTNGAVFTYTFNDKGRYNVLLYVTDNLGETDEDNQVIFINSKAPIADFDYDIIKESEPSRVFLDGTKSYDPDFSDFGRLTYRWIIDGAEVRLENPNKNNSTGYYTFDSVGEHNVGLEVSDPDDVTGNKVKSVDINSILSVDYTAFPRVVNKGGYVQFVANSKNARFFEWDFGDGGVSKGEQSRVTHKFDKSGTFSVELKVIDKDGEQNTFSKDIYVNGGNTPFAVIDATYNNNEDIGYEPNSCSGQSAFIINRANTVKFTGEESINSEGEDKDLEYSWKIRERYYTKKDVSISFDELGCYPVKLTVTDNKTGITNSISKWIKIENQLPQFTSIDITPVDMEEDPVVLNVSLKNAKDPDGIIQSYLWYYYTNTDPEPQGFRVTNIPKTSFVLPKVTNDYYFAVIMTDNNEAKVNTEEISDSRYFITLEGNNLNTPLVSLKVSDSSIGIGDDVIFNAGAKNVLGQDITNNSEFAWDFDGDGIYDQTTNTPNITYSYKSSGQIHPKVKVTYKGISNTKNVTLNVTNKLIPDFDYVSIGDKVIFVNKSMGEIVSSVLKYDDKQLSFPGKYLVHEFEDGKKLHTVTLKVQEGTNVKEIKKRILTNTRNFALSKRSGLNLFSYPEMNTENNTITLEKEGDNAILYLADSRGDFKYYAIDYDIYEDSNLNGGKDDDIDNKNDNSYTTGEPIVVKLNSLKEQNVRVFLLAEDEKTVVDKIDITIVKDYIDELNVDEVAFTNLSSVEETKIAKLKDYIKEFPAKDRLESSKLLERLQASWTDNREKTSTILEFEQYVDTIEFDITDKDDFINILESFLVANQEDNDAKTLSYNVVRNLIPTTIPDYSRVMDNLETIKNQNDVERNKELGEEILASIKEDTTLSDEEKLTIKTQLKVLIYNNSVPEDEQEEVPVVTPDNNEGGFISGLISFFKFILFIVVILIGLFVVGLLGFFVWYKISNKDENTRFQDFIIEKTGSRNNKKEDNKTDIFNDLLDDEDDDLVTDSNKTEDKPETKQEKQEEKISNKIDEENSEEDEKEDDDEQNQSDVEDKEEEKAPLDKADGEMPSWMRGAVEKVGAGVPVVDTKEEDIPKISAEEENQDDVGFEPKESAVRGSAEEENTEEKQDSNLPSWLDINKDEDNSQEDKKENNSENNEKPKEEKNKSDGEMPSWLTPDTSSEENTSSEDKEQEEEITEEDNKDESKDEKAKNNKNVDNDDDVQIPSWLKSSIGEDELKQEVEEELNSNLSDNKEENTEKSDLEDKADKDNKEEKEDEEEIPSWLERSKEEKAKEKQDDDVDLPSWLKPDTPAEEPKEEDTEEDNVEEELSFNSSDENEEKAEEEKPKKSEEKKKTPAKKTVSKKSTTKKTSEKKTTSKKPTTKKASPKKAKKEEK